jgi:hypothetical protein
MFCYCHETEDGVGKTKFQANAIEMTATILKQKKAL